MISVRERGEPCARCNHDAAWHGPAPEGCGIGDVVGECDCEGFAPRVQELRIRRESGDLDTLYLCGDCAESIADYARITRRRTASASCERCGA